MWSLLRQSKVKRVVKSPDVVSLFLSNYSLQNPSSRSDALWNDSIIEEILYCSNDPLHTEGQETFMTADDSFPDQFQSNYTSSW